MIGEINIDLIGIPEEATTINSEFLIKYKKANKDEKKETTGKVNIVKLRKLYELNCIITCKGTSLLVDFLNCSIKSPTKIKIAKIIKVIKKEKKKLLNKYIFILDNIFFPN
tara:strand:+ start:301 stop:633 length:333 start_codon:yes stop_codon:yes gene_type:complete